MKPSDFPLLTELSKRPYSGRGLSPSKVWEDTLDLIGQYKDKDTVPNARFKEMAETVNRAFDRAWHAQMDFLRPHREEEKDNKGIEALVWGGSPTLLSLPRFQKKVDALSDGLHRQTWKTLIDEIAPLAHVLREMKARSVKRKPLTSEEREAAKYQPPSSSSKSLLRVESLLNETVEKSFAQLVKFFKDRNRAYLASYQKGRAAAQKDPSLCRPSMSHPRQEKVRYSEHYDIEWHFTDKNTSSGKKNYVDRSAVSVVSKVYSWKGNTLSEKPDAMDILDQDAFDLATDIKKSFVVKNLRKLVSILEAKGDELFDYAVAHKGEVDLMGLRGAFDFYFKDGSSFSVNNSAVFVVNSFGTQFMRYPLTFHRVFLPDGTEMQLPSERRMNTVFVESASQDPASSSNHSRKSRRP